MYAYRNYLDFVKIPYSAPGIDVVVNDLTDLLGILGGVNNNATFEQGRLAVDRVLFEDCSYLCRSHVSERRRVGLLMAYLPPAGSVPDAISGFMPL